MANIVFTIAKGAAAEKVRDGATNLGLLLLKTAEADATLRQHRTVADVLAGGNVEADFTNYGRKSGVTGTVTVDDANNRVDVGAPDQTFANAGGATNNTVVKAIWFYQESASDAGRVPLVALDCVFTTDGTTDVLLRATAPFFRAL